MAEYINREDALEFPFANGIYDHEHANEHFISGCESYREWIKQIPAADVVEVVRCKDCVYGEVDDTDFPFQYLCHYHGDDWNDKDHYCSNGIKR